MIHLILFIRPAAIDRTKCLETALTTSICEPGLTVLRSVRELKTRLQQPNFFGYSEIYVLLAESKDCLIELFHMEQCFHDKRMILVLPDGERSTVAMAHRLRPRFVCYMDDDFKDLCAVIFKMIRNLQETHDKGKLNCIPR